MKPHALSRDRVSATAVDGRVLCEDLAAEGGKIVFRKGRILRGEDATELLRLSWEALHLVEMEAGDLHEDEAGRRLAEAVAGAGVDVGAPARGQWPLEAVRRGILEVAVDALRHANAVDGIGVFTHLDGRVVDAGEPVARARVHPLVIPEARLAAAVDAARAAGGLVQVRPFRPMTVGALIQERPGDAGDGFLRALETKLGWLGSRLLAPVFVAPVSAEIADGIGRLLDAGTELLVLAGARGVDPLDPVFAALERGGASVERYGVPAHPGSFLWLARIGAVPIVGVPSCGLFSQATSFDLVLPRLLTGDAFGAAELAGLGHGGFLVEDTAYRLPPYRSDAARGIG